MRGKDNVCFQDGQHGAEPREGRHQSARGDILRLELKAAVHGRTGKLAINLNIIDTGGTLGTVFIRLCGLMTLWLCLLAWCLVTL